MPVELVLLLLVLAIGSDILTIEFRGIRISGSFLALVLAMALLGPAPAAAIGVVATGIDALFFRRPWHRNLMNLAVWVWFPIIGSLIVEGWAGEAAPGTDNRYNEPGCPIRYNSRITWRGSSTCSMTSVQITRDTDASASGSV